MRRIRKPAAAALIIAGTLLLQSCVTSMGMTSASTPVDGKEMELLGKAEGRSPRVFTILSVYQFGRPDFDAAISDAVRQREGDALINVRWYEVTSYFVVVTTHHLVVTGDVVKFKEPPARRKI
jgi:flavin-binding protein dodecin